jgi:N-acetylneuraminic acid mutarotase
LAPLPQPVVFPFVCASEGILYVAGGGAEAVAKDTLQAYSTKTGKWTMLARMPAPRYHGCGAQCFNGELYIFGGWTNLPADNIFVYDPARNKWR